MSILFEKKGQKVIKVIFSIVGILVVISMVILYAPGILSFLTK